MAVGQKAYKAAQEKLDKYVRENGLRVSPVRNIVLSLICQLPQPFTADELKKACEAERISVGTVYNTLNLFVLAQILCTIKREKGSNFTEYELVTGTTPRMQVICTRCGRISDFHDQAIVHEIREHGYKNFNIWRFSLFVYGECKVCRRPGANNNENENENE